MQGPKSSRGAAAVMAGMTANAAVVLLAASQVTSVGTWALTKKFTGGPAGEPVLPTRGLLAGVNRV